MAVETMTGKRWAGGGLILACALALLGVIVLRPWESGPAASAGGAATPEQTVTLTMKGMHFEADRDTVKAGQPVTIVLKNNDTMNHQFSIDAFNVKTQAIGPGKTVSVTFTPDNPGDYAYRCPLLGHEAFGMVGTLHVTE
jgi:uncharacterized cupredoxin-like copper-binding protein